jgi:hypothetical protein
MRRGSEMIGSRIAAALEGRSVGEVVPLRGNLQIGSGIEYAK